MTTIGQIAPLSHRVSCIGYACGQGARQHGCAMGADKLYSMREFAALTSTHRKISILPTISCYLTDATDNLSMIVQSCQQLAEQIVLQVSQQEKFLVVGGDHSSAIGTWSGVRHAIAPQKKIGLLWIDAHMDSHTFNTSPSGMIHGMPLAALLGYGDARLTHLFGYQTKLDLGKLCLVGIRSFEPEEAQLLERLNVKVFFMEEIRTRGLQAVMQEALAIVQGANGGFGISIDMDAFDPSEIPAVGSPVHQGIDIYAFIHTLESICRHPGFLGAEIAEFNPELDHNETSAKLICRLIDAIFR